MTPRDEHLSAVVLRELEHIGDISESLRYAATLIGEAVADAHGAAPAEELRLCAAQLHAATEHTARRALQAAVHVGRLQGLAEGRQGDGDAH